MSRYTKILLALTLIPALAACSDDSAPTTPITPEPETGTALLRVIHASYDAPAVDIWIDGARAIEKLSYGASSGYKQVPAGERSVAVSASGSSDPILSPRLTLARDKIYTAVAVGAAASIDALVLDDARPSGSQMAYVRFLHAAADAPAVDIKAGSADASALFGDVSFKESTAYAGVPAGAYDLFVTPAGSNTAVVAFEPVTLKAGQYLTVVAKGTLDANDAYPFLVTAFSDDAATSDRGAALKVKPAGVEPPPVKQMARVLAVHAAPDAPAVDIWVDDAKGVEGLAFPSNTGYLELEAGERRIRVNPAGSTTSVIDATLALAPDKSYSVFATGTLDDLQPLVLEDDLTPPAAGKAHVRFVHLSPDAPAVDIALAGGPVVIANKAFREHTPLLPLDAGSYDLEVRVADTMTVALPLPGIRLEAGKIYTVFARGLLAGSGGQALGAEIIVNN